jgi:hypothetical protein
LSCSTIRNSSTTWHCSEGDRPGVPGVVAFDAHPWHIPKVLHVVLASARTRCSLLFLYSACLLASTV